jgi:hypothetical protein
VTVSLRLRAIDVVSGQPVGEVKSTRTSSHASADEAEARALRSAVDAAVAALTL